MDLIYYWVVTVEDSYQELEIVQIQSIYQYRS